jgi:phage shock protein PspC (stress-responsive transcriptional regulator)
MKPSTGLETDMRKVTTINLNNNAYQIDELGYDALRDYLSAAERNLEGNPDREEILADLEQAIGDKCQASLGAHKTVVTVEDIQRILQEMGPVEPAAPSTATGAGTADAAPAGGGIGSGAFPRRMYRLEEGSMWAGVCTGLGAYFGVDVVWMRVIFVLLTLFTSGVWILIYIAMCFIVPKAETAEERAAAHGAPFNAYELMNRVKKKSEKFRPSRPRMNARASWFRTQEPVAGSAPGYAARVTGGLLLPVFTVLSAVWFTAMLIAMIAVWNMHGVFGLDPWPQGAQGWANGPPRWMAIVAVAAVWMLVAIPIGAGRRASLFYANGGRSHGWADALSGLLWFVLVWGMIFFAWQFLPGVQEAVRGLLAWSRLDTTFI